MSKPLTSRERRLLGACIAVLVIAVTTLSLKEFLDRSSAAEKKIAALQAEKRENDSWLQNRDFLLKQKAWLEQNIPTTDSLGRTQGLLLEECRSAALDNQIRIVNSSLPATVTTAHYKEAPVTLKLYGDQAKIMSMLAGLQSPEKFYVIKSLQLNPDGRSKEPTPQIECDITIARWFKPDGGTAPAPAS